MPNCVIYCRVSTEEQAIKGYSLETQEKLCRDFAERNHYLVVGVYREEGKTARSLDRPMLTELLADCERKAVDAVIVQETDRLARNTKDHLTVRAMLKKADVKLISMSQPMLDDSPEGIMIDTILASVNQFQSDINARKTKRGLQEKFELGWWPGIAPLGYKNVTVESATYGGKPIRMIIKDPEKWPFIREGFDLYMKGHYSILEISDRLYQKGLRARNGKQVAHSVMYKIFRNPFYAGQISWNGQTRQGSHEPMITREEHERVLQVMDSHNLHASRKRKHRFLLSGFAYCHICGHRYTGEIHPAKRKAYYHCAAIRTHTNRHQNVAVLQLEREVEKQFQHLQFNESFSQAIVEKLRTVYIEKRTGSHAQKHVLYNKKSAIEAKRDRAEEKLIDGVLTDEAFIRMRTKYMEEIAQIQEQLDELDVQQEIDLDVLQEVLRMSRDIYSAYRSASHELKRLYLGLFWEKFLVQDKKIVQAIPTELIRALQHEQKVIIRSDWYPLPSLTRTLEDQTYMAELKAKLCDIMLLLPAGCVCSCNEMI